MAADLLSRMRSNPRDWRIDDVVRVCSETGATCTPPRGGSHDKVEHAAMPMVLVVPAHRPIKPVYIRALVRFIDAIREAET